MRLRLTGMMQGAKSEVLTPAVASAKPSPTPAGTPVGGEANKSPGQKMMGMGVKYVLFTLSPIIPGTELI